MKFGDGISSLNFRRRVWVWSPNIDFFGGGWLSAPRAVGLTWKGPGVLVLVRRERLSGFRACAGDFTGWGSG